jgi:hypothetical protein
LAQEIDAQGNEIVLAVECRSLCVSLEELLLNFAYLRDFDAVNKYPNLRVLAKSALEEVRADTVVKLGPEIDVLFRQNIKESTPV